MRSATLAVLLWAALLGGCAPPIQYGGAIPVHRRGLPSRLAQLCRMGATSAPGDVCERPAPAEPAVQPPVEGVPEDPYLAIDEGADESRSDVPAIGVDKGDGVDAEPSGGASRALGDPAASTAGGRCGRRAAARSMMPSRERIRSGEGGGHERRARRTGEQQ